MRSVAVFVVVGRVHIIRVIGCSSGQCRRDLRLCLLFWEVLILSHALFVVVGIVNLFSGIVCSSGQCSCYQSHWL